MKNRETMRFFYSPSDRDFIQENCKRYWPHEVEEVIERAALACENTFVFTHRWDMERCEDPYTFKNGIDWTFRFQGDFEWTVNLNRARFMAELGQAYWLTGEERFAASFIRLMNDWLRQNPVTEEEIHQSSARQYNVKDTWRKLDSGIRITNWLKGFFCIQESEQWGEVEQEAFIRALELHGLYLSIAYTPHDRQSNWGFLETNGLFQIALLFPEIEGASQWLRLAEERLETMCELQVFEDGMHNEQSPMYHHEVLHCLFEPVLLANINQHPLPKKVRDTLNTMFTASLSWVKPDGRQPMISDSDHTDIRDILTQGAVLYQRGDLKSRGYSVLDYEGIWYFGEDGMKNYQALPKKEPAFGSTLLAQSGYSVMRTDWSEEAHYLLFDGGHMDIIRAHGHDDFLHFDLTVFGTDFLLDTGRYTYMENEERRYFKESFQHNTTSVDDFSISVYENSWSWGAIAQPTNGYWNSSQAFDYVQAGHTGYKRLEDPVDVLRQILFVKPYYWIIVDTFRSQAEHEFKQHFHFDEYIALDTASAVINAQANNGIGLNMISLEEAVVLEEQACWISKHYNQKAPSRKMTATQTGKGFTKFVTALVPWKQNETLDFSITKIDTFDTRNRKQAENEATAIEVKRGGSDAEVIVFSHQGPFSCQCSGAQMTGEVLLLKRQGEQEQTWVVKV
ncbi:alginate lyase family protein [Salibacterium aidingense]|uniref:alginate lyase family protein n=1 Tax=Salibacterium aidingense TaxID=384933 RepID=UPI0003FB73C2|nr:alginate lyase family protein [Salibacterium aidingense]